MALASRPLVVDGDGECTLSASTAPSTSDLSRSSPNPARSLQTSSPVVWGEHQRQQPRQRPARPR
eukprot:4117180-Pyramimonas_sp.AAC.1